MREVRLRIADIVLSLESQDGAEFGVGDEYRAFSTDAEPAVRLQVHVGMIPAVRVGQPVFDSEASLTLFQDPRSWTVCLRSPASGREPYQVAILSRDFLSGDIYCQSNGRLPFPLAYPFAETLMVSLLSRGRGVELHACGVADRGRGLLFAGTSGAGKSTLARILTDRAGLEILSDDRVIVREREGCLWIYGTPFHGDARLASPLGVPLEHIFLIAHAQENRLTALDPLDAASRLLVRCFPPFWDAEGMAFTVGLLGEIAQRVPCHELGFVPDDRVVDFVRCLP